MYDNDELSDTAGLRELRNALAGVAMPDRPRLEAIIARGRRHQRRRISRVAALSVGVAAAGTALVVGLTGVLGSAPNRGTIRTAAFTLVSHTNGTASLTINARVLLVTRILQSDLARYGIPATVTNGSFCSSDPAPAGFSQVVSFQPPFQGNMGRPGALVNPTITINPAAMPAGTELSFGNFRDYPNRVETAIALIDTNSNSCSSTAPNTPPSGGALLA
jgi:hypothetical protein